MLKNFKIENKSFFERVAKDFKDSDIDFNYYENLLYYAYEKTFDLAMDFLISNRYNGHVVKNDVKIIYTGYIENFGDDLCKRIMNLIKKTIHENTKNMPNYHDLDSIVRFTFKKIEKNNDYLNMFEFIINNYENL